MESKKDIRRRILNTRDSLTPKEWEEKTYAIYQKVVTHPFFLCTDVIYCYVDYRREVGTLKIIEKAWALHKKIAVPKIVGDAMEFYFIEALTDLTEGYRGILEPKSLHLANEKEPLVIMPGTVFDRTRNRIGYGKGFYDKFLNAHPDCKTIALSFECQLVDAVPRDKHDIQPTYLITEENMYYDEPAK